MPAEMAWTEAGRAALEAELARGIPLCTDRDVTPQVAALVKRYAPAWHKGLAKTDAVNEPLVTFAIGWKAGTKLTAAQAATILTLLSPAEDAELSAVCEHVAREGIDLALRTLIHLWSQVVDYKGETDKGRAVWITAIAPDHQHVMDASGARMKGAFARYLGKVHRAASPAARKNMTKAARAVWKSAPRHAKPPLAVAVNDAALAAEIARELLDHDKPHAFYAWEELPYLVTEVALVEELLPKRDARLSYRILDNLGAAALPLYERALEASLSSHARADLFAQLANVRSPWVARRFGEYSDSPHYAATLSSYFTAHPDLLELAISDPELRYHADDLAKLRA